MTYKPYLNEATENKYINLKSYNSGENIIIQISKELAHTANTQERHAQSK